MDVRKWLGVHWDRLVAITCMVLAATLMTVGWLGMSGTPYPAEQLPYILSGGLGGLLFVGFAAMFWLSADLRDEWNKLDVIDSALRDLNEAPAE